jgi:hypothetical protein
VRGEWGVVLGEGLGCTGARASSIDGCDTPTGPRGMRLVCGVLVLGDCQCVFWGRRAGARRARDGLILQRISERSARPRAARLRAPELAT